MNLKFHESLDELKKRFEKNGLKGDWLEKEKDSFYQLKLKNGAAISFWPKKGTIFVQAKPEFKEKIEIQVCTAIGAEIPAQLSGGVNSKYVQKITHRIFVVHGHDTSSRDQLELALRRLGLEPFILMNTSGEGKTIIEALEGQIGKDYSSDFGIVLMTPDDIGYARLDGHEKSEPRARQNVVLETGMLLSSLTRARMALVVKGHVELPSDLQGIIRFNFNDHIREVLPKLVGRMKDAGIFIEEGKLTDSMA